MMISGFVLNKLIEQKDIPFGINQARREIELFEMIYQKESVNVSDLAHAFDAFTFEIDLLIKDLQSYELIKVIQRRKHPPYGDEAVGLPYNTIILTDTGRKFGKLLEIVSANRDALMFIRKKRDSFVVAGDIADKFGYEDDKDIIQDLEDNGVIYFHNDVYWLSNIGERLADLFEEVNTVC